MNKQRTFFIVAIAAALAVAAALRFAGDGPPLAAQVFDGGGLTGGLTDAKGELQGSGLQEETDIIIVIANIINFALTFAAIAAFVAFIVSGFMFILGFGSDQTIQRARKIMLWSIVGLIVILLSIVITQLVIDLGTAQAPPPPPPPG